jgi:hypothetical protein
MVTTKSPTPPFSVLYSVSSALGPGPGFLLPPSELGGTGVSSLPARVGRCIPSPYPHPQACLWHDSVQQNPLWKEDV